ncbi:MAG: transglutaminase-like domain-containing protein [Rudaea sp.]
MLALLVASAVAIASPADDSWMTVLLDGRKIGNMHMTRRVERDRVITSQALTVEFARAGTKVGLTSSETDTETRDGKPLTFESRSSISGIESVIRGTIHGATCELTTEVGGNRKSRTIAWPKGALLAEGLRIAESRTELKPGEKFTELAFQAESADAVEVTTTVGDKENVDLPIGTRKLVRIEQLIELPGAPTSSVAWINDDQDIEKMTMSVMGYELTMLACSKTCAKGPNQSTDILTHALAAAPVALTTDDLHRGVVISMSSTQANTSLSFASTDEQRVIKTATGFDLRVEPIALDSTAKSETPPQPADSKPNDWLQSDAPEVRKLAQKGIGDAKEPLAEMQNLETFVRGFIRNKNLNVGYASALEVAKNPEGDCTEHAVLLAALGRSVGIPTRVVDGLAYTQRYAGMDHVFVPHAWAQAWVNGRWQSFDAALMGFDAGHIALSVGDGDPWRFFAGLDTLGHMKVDAVRPLTIESAKSP